MATAKTTCPGHLKTIGYEGSMTETHTFIAALTLTAFVLLVSSALSIMLTKNGLQYGGQARAEVLRLQQQRSTIELIYVLQTYHFSAIGQTTSNLRSGTKWING